MTDEQVTPKKSWGQLLVVSSLIFGMFFGSGNLIFPVHLGQLAGAHWWLAAIGFAISGSLFPLLAIMAVVVTRSDGLLDLARPLGRPVAATFFDFGSPDDWPILCHTQNSGNGIPNGAQSIYATAVDHGGDVRLHRRVLYSDLFSRYASRGAVKNCGKVPQCGVLGALGTGLSGCLFTANGECHAYADLNLSDACDDWWGIRGL